MSTHHEVLLEKAKDAIEKVFSDTSVSAETTRNDLEELSEDIELKIQSICDSE